MVRSRSLCHVVMHFWFLVDKTLSADVVCRHCYLLHSARCMIWRFFPLPGIIGISPPYSAYIALLQASFAIRERRRISNHDAGAFSPRLANRTNYDADMGPGAGIAKTESTLPHWHNTVESIVLECHRNADHGSWTAFDEWGAGSSGNAHNIHNLLAGDWSD